MRIKASNSAGVLKFISKMSFSRKCCIFLHWLSLKLEEKISASSALIVSVGYFIVIL